jgi:hypothetical protein
MATTIHLTNGQHFRADEFAPGGDFPGVMAEGVFSTEPERKTTAIIPFTAIQYIVMTANGELPQPPRDEEEPVNGDR